MAINYYLRPHINNNPENYAARVQPKESLDLKGVTKCMLRKGSTVREADIIAVLQLFFETKIASTSQICL